jgi:hypothetical protein
MPRQGSFVSALLALLLAACSEQPANDAAPGADAPDKAADTVRSATDAADTTPVQRRAEHLREQIGARVEQVRERRAAHAQWWNEAALADELGLDQAQRDAIDARVAGHQATRERMVADARAAQQDFRAAVAAGELDRAREAARRHAALGAELDLGQRLLVVDVLETLAPAQRQIMVTEHPGLLSAMVSGRGRPGRAGRAD